jgi:hypothetical protein
VLVAHGTRAGGSRIYQRALVCRRSTKELIGTCQLKRANLLLTELLWVDRGSRKSTCTHPPKTSGRAPWPARTEVRWLLGLLVIAALILIFGLIAEEVTEGDAGAFDRRILLLFRSPTDPSRLLGPAWLPDALRDLTSAAHAKSERMRSKKLLACDGVSARLSREATMTFRVKPETG